MKIMKEEPCRSFHSIEPPPFSSREVELGSLKCFWKGALKGDLLGFFVGTCIRQVIKILASGNGRFAELNFPFRETFAVSFVGHLHTYFMISRIMPGPYLEVAETW